MSKSITKIVKATLGLTMAIGAGVGAGLSNPKANQVYASEYDSLYSANFTTVANHSYTQNKEFALNGKSWTSSVSQVSSSVFYLGCNSNNASKGILNDNSTFSEIVTFLRAVDAAYDSNYTTAHAYALLFGNAYDDVSKVTFNWSGTNNVFQVYLFGYSGTSWSKLANASAANGSSASGSLEWTGSATNYAKFAVVARPGAAGTTATSKTLRASSFEIFKTGSVDVCSVTYSDGGATGGTVPTDNTEYTIGDTVTVLGNSGNLVREDYTFNGWTDGVATFDEDDTFEISSDTILTAVWVLDAGVDVLTKSFTGISSNYADWFGKAGVSGAVYAGNSGGDKESVQLRTDNDNSGIVSTTSGGNVKKVSVVWHSDTTDGRVLNVYGKNTAYSAATDLYSNSGQGELLGTIVKGTSTSLTIDDGYRYIGLRSDDKAMYLSSINIKWEEAQLNPRVSFNPAALELKTNQTVASEVTALAEDIISPQYTWTANDEKIILDNETINSVTVKIMPNVNSDDTSSVTVTVKGTNATVSETLAISISEPGPGETAEKAFTIAQARSHIDKGADDEYYYATGIVSEIVTPYSPQYHNITYNISSDGLTTSDQLQAYRGKGIGGANFASEDDILVGDKVIVYGKLIKHNETYEFAQDNQLVSRATVNSISLNPLEITLAPNAGGNVADLFTNIVINQDEGLNNTLNDIAWSVEDENVLLVDDGEYVVTGNHRSSTTIYASLNGRVYGSALVNVIDPNIHSIAYTTTSLEKASSISAGDKIVFAYEKGDVKKELTGITTIGVASDYDSEPTCSYLLTVVAGNANNSIAFKTSDNLYLSWVSGNTLTTSEELNDSSSWTVSVDDSNFKFTNVGTTDRVLQYNTGSPRFACYATNQSAFQIYKKTENVNYVDLESLSSEKTAFDDGNKAYVRLGATLSEEDWAAMDSAFGISGYGVMLIRKTTLNNAGFDSIEAAYRSENAIKDSLKDLRKDSDVAPEDFSVVAKINVTSESNREVEFCAATYVVSESGTVYFIDEVSGSLVDLLP